MGLKVIGLYNKKERKSKEKVLSLSMASLLKKKSKDGLPFYNTHDIKQMFFFFFLFLLLYFFLNIYGYHL